MIMQFDDPPPTAAWAHRGARQGFEVTFFERSEGGHLITGCTTALEDEQTWVVDYQIQLDQEWITRRARVTGRSTAGSRTLVLEADGTGSWTVDGNAAPLLLGCLDLDLEASAMTNAFPMHRLPLAVGDRASTAAAYVRAADLTVERLEQTYARRDDEGERRHYDYSAPDLDFACELTYDSAGLVLTYPGLAVRAT
jgi:hypothetical protein